MGVGIKPAPCIKKIFDELIHFVRVIRVGIMTGSHIAAHELADDNRLFDLFGFQNLIQPPCLLLR